MKLQTHIAFGIFFGVILYYFFNLDLLFILIAGFSAFIPDIDLTIQRWKKSLTEKHEGLNKLNNVSLEHRTFTHNVWAMLLLVVASLIITANWVFPLAITVGFFSHLIADSFTVMGVYWLWPYKKKLYFKGTINMSQPENIRRERIIQIILLAMSGLLFFMKGQDIGNIFSLNGLILIGVFIFAGSNLMKKLLIMILKIIRTLRI